MRARIGPRRLPLPCILASGLLAALLLQGCGLGNDGRVCGTEIADPDETIAGCLIDNKGGPAVGVRVRLSRENPQPSVQTPANAAQPSGEAGSALVGGTETDRRGRFAFHDVPAGRYTLQFLDSSGRPVADNLAATVQDAFTSAGIHQIFRVATISGVVLGAESGAPIVDADCYVPGKPYSAMTDDAGRFELHVLPEKTGNVYSVRCSRPQMETATLEGVQVEPGGEAEVEFRLRLEYVLEPRPPAPIGLKAVYDSVKGVVRLSWNRVFYSEPVVYYVKRFDPLNIAAFKVFTTPDTFYNDYIFPPEPDPSGTGKPIDLIFNVKTSLLNSNTLSVNHAYAEVKGVKPPPYTGPEVLLSAVDRKDEYAVGDTVRLAGEYRNPKRPNRRLYWSVDGIEGELMGRALSDSAGTDTLAYRLDTPGTTRIRFTVIDQAGLSASAWIPLPVVERP